MDQYVGRLRTQKTITAEDPVSPKARIVGRVYAWNFEIERSWFSLCPDSRLQVGRCLLVDTGILNSRCLSKGRQGQ